MNKLEKRKTRMILKNILPKKIKTVLLLNLILISCLYSQSQRSTLQILGISVEGNKSADATTIIANTGLNVGEEITPNSDITMKAVNRLWSLNIFEDVKIVVEKRIENGVFLQIRVKEYPRLEEVVIEGEDELGEDDILEKINVRRRGQILKTQDIFRAITEIKALYEEDGYLNADITPVKFEFFRADTADDEVFVTWRNENDFSDEYETEYEYEPGKISRALRRIEERVLLMFRIDEGDEVVVREIEFNGNTVFDDSDLKGEFDETSEARWWKFWSSSNLNREKYKEDKDLLKDFYKKNGFIDFYIISDSLAYSEDKQDVFIKLNIYEGPQYKIRDIQWEGNTVYPDMTLTERLDFQRGDIYDLTKFNQNLYYNERQSDVSSLYQDNGYLMFSVEPKEEKIGADSVDISIKVHENNRFKIAGVNISGNDRTKEKVIRRELYTIPGDHFSRNNLIRSLQQLANLQYFNVEKLYQQGVNPRPVSDSTVNINYSVEEKSSDYLNASVGYSGSFGFSGAVGVTLNNFSISEPFRLGGGQILNFNWQFGVGNYYRTFSLGFTEPWFMDTPTLVGFDVFDTRQRYVYDLRQSGGTFKVGRRLTWPDNYFYIQGLLRFQYNDVIDGRSIYLEGISRQYTLGATISRTDIDNPIFPSKGSKLSLNMELSGGPVLPGDVDYFKVQLKTEWYKRLFNSNRLALYTGLDFGYLKELVSGTPVQPFEYFYMGGNGLIIATTPLRGYVDRSVGPRNSAGNTIGSRVMAKYTLELRGALALEPIPIYLLAFAEAGNTYLDLKETDFTDLKRSVGFGARILINPIGLIGFDYGYGFDRRTVDGADPQWKFHFQFGKGF